VEWPQWWVFIAGVSGAVWDVTVATTRFCLAKCSGLRIETHLSTHSRCLVCDFIDNFRTATCNHREVDHRAGGVANEWPVRPGRIVASLSGDVGPSRDQIIDVAPNASGGRNGLSDSMYYIY